MTVPTRVLVVGVNYAPERSGIAPYTTRTARGLARAGCRVDVLTSRPHYPEWQVPAEHARAGREQDGDVVVRRLRHYIPEHPTWLRRIWFELSFGLRVTTARWGRPDVVVCVSPALLSSLLVALRARFSRHRPALGVVVQDLYSRGVAESASGGSRAGRLAARFEGWVLGLFDGVSVIHDRFRAVVVDVLDVDPGRCTVIRNWTHVAATPAFDVAAFRQGWGWGEEVVVLHAGAMGHKQGLENVVEAARHAASVGAPVRFVLMGDGSQRGALQEIGRGLEALEFRSQVDDTTFGQALAAADVLLVNEKAGVKEMAVPSKLTSYFRAGRPVLAATDAGSTTAEELGAAEAGVRIDAGDPAALVAAATALARDPGSASFGPRGQAYADAVLSEEAAMAAYRRWVETLAAGRT